MSHTAVTLHFGCRCHWNDDPKPPPTMPILTSLPAGAALSVCAAAETPSPPMKLRRVTSAVLSGSTGSSFRQCTGRQPAKAVCRRYVSSRHPGSDDSLVQLLGELALNPECLTRFFFLAGAAIQQS